jgi:hypothetical protein
MFTKATARTADDILFGTRSTEHSNSQKTNTDNIHMVYFQSATKKLANTELTSRIF